MRALCLGAGFIKTLYMIKPLNAELNPIYHLLALLGAHHIFHVSGLRVNCLPMQAVNKQDRQYTYKRKCEAIFSVEMQ